MKQYLEAMQHILDNGVDKENRTGTDTRSVFGYQMRFDLSKGFPAVTTKKLAFKSVKSELLWFLDKDGSDDERRLAEIHYGKPREELIDKTTIWTANAKADYWRNSDEYKRHVEDYNWKLSELANGKLIGGEAALPTHPEGYLGRIYGQEWRDWGGVDQIEKIIDQLKNNPNDRRIILTAYNVDEIECMALPPCHVLYNFNVTNNKLNCMMFQRSADFFLGSNFNISSVALLMHMLAQVCDLEVGDFVYSISDMHLYHNHFNQAREQISREPLPLPTLYLNPVIKNINDFTMDDIKLIDYQHHETILAPMAV